MTDVFDNFESTKEVKKIIFAMRGDKPERIYQVSKEQYYNDIILYIANGKLKKIYIRGIYKDQLDQYRNEVLNYYKRLTEKMRGISIDTLESVSSAEIEYSELGKFKKMQISHVYDYVNEEYEDDDETAIGFLTYGRLKKAIKTMTGYYPDKINYISDDIYDFDDPEIVYYVNNKTFKIQYVNVKPYVNEAANEFYKKAANILKQFPRYN